MSRGAIREKIKQDITVNAAIKRGLTKDIDAIKAKKERLLNALLEGDIDRELFNLKKAEYEAKQKELEELVLKYGTDNEEIYDILEEIADVAGNAKKYSRAR